MKSIAIDNEDKDKLKMSGNIACSVPLKLHCKN